MRSLTKGSSKIWWTRGRAVGSFCSRRAASSRTGGEHAAGSGGGSAPQIFITSAGIACAMNGGASASISYRMTPRLHTSHEWL